MLSPVSRLYVTIFRDALPRRLCLMLLPLFCLACDGVSRPDDTLGLQSSARWEWHGRLVVEPDSALTLVRMAIDTAHGGHDVGLARYDFNRSEEHTSELQSRQYLVCRLLLEKKKKRTLKPQYNKATTLEIGQLSTLLRACEHLA